MIIEDPLDLFSIPIPEGIQAWYVSPWHDGPRCGEIGISTGNEFDPDAHLGYKPILKFADGGEESFGVMELFPVIPGNCEHQHNWKYHGVRVRYQWPCLTELTG